MMDGCSAQPFALRGLALLVVPLALVASGCIDIVSADLGKYVERDEKHFSVSGTPEVVLTTFDGSIEVRPWDKPEVQVVIEKRGRDKADVAELDVESQQNGDHVEVSVKEPRTHGFRVHFGGRSAKLIVSVPARADLQARSGDGSIDVERIDGHVQLRSGDGSIRAHDMAGDLDVHTGDGSINVGGKLTGPFRARSGDGAIAVHAASGSTAGADWDIVTGDGSVTLELPDGFGAELDAHTGDGRIHMQDMTLSNVSGEIGRSSLRGRIGSGGRNLRVRTGDGSITLKRS
jgi:putative adhesin